MLPIGRAPGAADCSGSGGEWILVVEDDPALLQLIERALRPAGHRVVGVRSGGAALAALDPVMPRLLVLDYGLPDMRGEQLLEHMQARGKLVPFVVATGRGSESVAVEMMKRGAYDYLVKDAGFLQLLPVVVEQAIAHARQAERLAEAEAQLHAAHQQLEQRVEQRTAELAQANCRLRVEMEERRRAEEQISQHQAELAHVARLSAVGEMMAELTHELNQPLSAVCGFAQACQRLLEAKDAGGHEELAGALQQIRQQGDRAVEIIRRMRRFTVKHRPSRERLAINTILRDVAALMSIDARLAGAEICFALADPLPDAWADRMQVEQVLVNLMRNGLEALRGCSHQTRRLTLRTWPEGHRWVVVEVQDNGPGIADEVASRLFERFYTTKSDGMGLGLPISRAFVESQGGRLDLVDGAGPGATFRITLPSHLGVSR